MNTNIRVRLRNKHEPECLGQYSNKKLAWVRENQGLSPYWERDYSKL
jgi:hypothetical protein